MATSADQESEFAESLLQNLETAQPFYPPKAAVQGTQHQQQRRKPAPASRPGGHFGGNPVMRGNGQQGNVNYADTWEEYEQMIGGVENMIPVQYAPDGAMYTSNEADFVQSFVGNTQFLPYQQPGYFQHPGFTSQLYADGRQMVFPPNQMYPFPQQFAMGGQVMLSPENFHQLQQAFNAGQMQFVAVDPQSAAAAPGILDATGLTAMPVPVPVPVSPASVMFESDADASAVANGVGKISVKDDTPKQIQKKPSGPRSWADIANAPALPPPPKPAPPKPTPAAPTPAPTMRSVIPGASPGGAGAKAAARPDDKSGRPMAKGPGSGVLQLQPGTFNSSPAFAKFFVIKSYSEDDVHKSIKYNIWASTDTGNRRLDQAWKEYHEKGPIYLFFSVNGSGQFCGMAEMMSAVDYHTKSDVWAQDKWNGKFAVKWIFIKDIPNQALRNIRLENNENKPVTNSRDTQEIFLEPGREMLKIVASFKARTSIMDDFSWYDQRQEELKSKKADDAASDSKPAPPPPTLASAASVLAVPARTDAASSDAPASATKTVKFATVVDPGKKAAVITIGSDAPTPAPAPTPAADSAASNAKKKGKK
eukprot:TRINITY_DN5701_c0_g1_i1.p2 TRINITY_DN5701_c0_g1~~TRINITY_DN5701_c0_g1_i1.p2  ORF type:complete len:591 (+),score=211.35 TRINITY_DN5701_c0_g1_i1:91-1863(+)